MSLTIVPGFILNVGSAEYARAITTPGADLGAAIANAVAFHLPWYALLLAAHVVAQSCMTVAVTDDQAGGRASFLGGLRTSARSLVAAIAASLLANLIALLGFVCCFLPGVLAWVAFYLVTPAIVAERLGPVEGIRRSLALTREHRRVIFLLVVGLLAFSLVASWMLFPLELALADRPGLPPVFLDMGSPKALTIFALRALLTAAVNTFGRTVVAVTYARIRTRREENDTAAVAKVFE